MFVSEIFASIDGEGKRTGLPTVFIRLYGCNLNCSYCDTRYGCEGEDYTTMSIGEIVDGCKATGINSITITGGEPLIHPGIEGLITELLREGFWVNVETNGTVDVDKFRSKLNGNIHDLFFTMDYKCPSSGMETKMNWEYHQKLRNVDVLKFVVGNTEDLDTAIMVLDAIQTKAEVYFSPVFGKIEPAEIVRYILEHKLFNCKVQVQLHKIIWEPNERGV